MEIFLIDAIGPFFRGVKGQRINWSKIPFHQLQIRPKQRRKQFDHITRDLDTFAAAVSRVGYNSVSLDDVAHLSQDSWHEPQINQIIAIYQEEFHPLFALLKRHDLDIYLTMDVLTYTPGLETKINGSRKRATAFLKRQIDTVFSCFPEITGLILRIGECDGKDVKGDFKSKLFLHTPRQVNSLLHSLLPIFEHHQRTMILRTWTVGAHPIGDFSWHRRTMAKALQGIESPNFILSMKYGESDFFRYLPLNKQFFRTKVRKLIELQAKREYEGCGEYPSFIGWDYEAYARQLKNADAMAGISVWCQTGGWLPFRRLTYLEPAGFWNELNSFVTLKLFQHGWPVEEAVIAFCDQIGCTDPKEFLELLQLDDEVIKELLYISEVADKKLFFRRVRIPPLLSVLWNNIFINHSVRKVLLSLVTEKERCVEVGYLALDKIKRMQKIAVDLGLPEPALEDLRYMEDTFHLLALAREYYLLSYDESMRERIRDAKRKYKKRYPKKKRPRYRVKTNFTPFSLKRRHLNWLLKAMVRNKRGYRLIDHLLTLHLLGIIYRVLIWTRPKTMPKFARKRAMGIDTIFR